MKRILGALISSVMLAVTCLTTLPVSAKEEYTEYIVPFYSDQTKQRQVLGISNKSLLKDGVVLIPLETACEIAGASIAAENDEAALITRNYVSWCCKYKDEKNQYLLVDSHTGEGDYYESALDCLIEPPQLGELFQYSPYDNTFEFPVDFYHQTKISCQYYDNKFYVSFYEFLVMMGVDVDLINHEAINEITAFYTSMAEEYSDDEDYKTVASEIDKLFSAGTGYEQFFYCSLGTPIDELYKAYYDSDLMCDLGDYYGDGKVEWANLVNAVENYDGLTKTALAALNLNTDYEDVLINTVTYHGDSEDDNFSKTVDDSVDIIQRLLYVRDFGLSVEEIYRDDSVLETVWKMQEKADNIEPILSSVDDFDVDFSLSPDAISMVYSGLCGAMKNYAKYREMSNLFEGEQYLMKNTILSSDAMARNTADEARGMFISHILNPMGNVIEMHSNLRNEENSYFNLYHSAAKVQETMNASSPAAWAAVWGAIEEATYSAGDDLIMGVIDYTFFGGMPVSSLVNSGILFCVDGLKNTAYGKEQSQIAELDDYVFIQEVANDCFKEHSLASENARSSFILGLKATMLAYKTNGEDSSWDPNNKDSDSIKAYNDMKMMFNVALSNSINTDFYNAFPNGCDDLTEMLGSNTDISKLDTTPRQDITLEFGEETNEPTKSETINYEEIYYSYIENELIPKYGLASLEQFEIDQNEKNGMPNTSFGIVSADIDDYDDDNTKELIVLTLEPSEKEKFYCDINLHLYSIEDNKVKYADSEYLYGYQMYDIHSDNFFTLDKCNNELLFTNNVCYFSGEAASSNVTIIKIVNSNFVSENMTTSDYEGEKLYVNGNEVCNSNDDINFYETTQRIISQKLMENGFSFDNVEYKGRSINVSVTNNTKIAKYSATFDSSSTNWFSVISPNDFTNLREQISQLEETPVNTFDIKNYCGKYVSTDLPILIEITKTEDSDVGIYVEIWNNSVTRQSSSKIIAKTTSNPFMYETSDSHGNTNSYTLEFGKDRIILNAECIDYGGSWSIPIVTNAVLQKETLFESTTSWQQLYADELRKYINSDNYSSDAMFDLYDFDNDGIVELIVSSGEAHLCTCSVFGLKDGAMTLLCENIGEYGSLSVYEGGIVCGTFTPSGPGQTMKNTKFIKISSGNSESLYELTAEGFPPDYDRYTINGTEATAEEYDNIMNQYITQEPLQYSIGRKYPLDEATINSILLSSSTRIGTIITENDALNVRQSPSTESEKIGTVDKGSTITILSEVNGWYEIEFNGKSGYVLGEYVHIVE